MTTSSQISNTYLSTPTISYSLIQDSSGSAGWDAYLGVDGGGNINADPLFVRDPDPGPDGEWDGVDDDYGDLRLQAGSPAINTGTNLDCPTKDMDGYPRPHGPACDMGAYEYQYREYLFYLLLVLK